LDARSSDGLEWMSILSAVNLARSFGPDDIFSGVSLTVPRGARIAIVGPNGIGKTTLLRILVGLDEPSSGTVQRAKGLSLGYLPQEADLTAPHTLWEECLSAFAKLREQERELARLEAAMADPEQAGKPWPATARCRLGSRTRAATPTRPASARPSAASASTKAITAAP
jgi:ATPase subunit of ABC transporter with duplicated ATPase domains